MNTPSCKFYAIGDPENDVYLRVHYFDGEIHYRFDAEHILDARLFKNHVEVAAVFATLVDLKLERQMHIYAFNCNSAKI